VLAFLVALLLVRLIVLLMAARPDNAGVAALLASTDILVWPFAWIDATQPVYGSRFERGTLLALVLLLVGMRINARR
jgi:hypothetical protein